MFKKDLKNEEELLLRKKAAEGMFSLVEKILNKNKSNPKFNINAQSSNGNTALHWACLNAAELHDGYSEKYNRTIRLLIHFGADHLVKNNDGKIPNNFLQCLHTGVFNTENSKEILLKNSCYLGLIEELLKKECKKVTSAEELSGELASATAFHVIISSLKLFDFFPTENNQQETFTILSLACGTSSEIIPLILYFQHHNKKINYVGIDNNRDIIEDNKARYANFKNVEFFCADASNLNGISTRTAPHSIDLGILRNGDFSEHKNRRPAFCRMVDQVLPNMIKPDYPLLITFQTHYELEVCSKSTQLLQNFIKLKSHNFCDVGTLCFFYSQYLNNTVITYLDRFSTILNLDKTASAEALLELDNFKNLRL